MTGRLMRRMRGRRDREEGFRIGGKVAVASRQRRYLPGSLSPKEQDGISTSCLEGQEHPDNDATFPVACRDFALRAQGAG